MNLGKTWSLFVVLILGCAGVLFAAEGNGTAVPEPVEESAIVSVFGEELFPVYGRVGVVSAEQRAASMADKVRKLKKDSFFKTDHLRVVDNKWGDAEIVYMEKIPVAYVTGAQAAALGSNPHALASEYRDRIADAVMRARENAMPMIIAEQCGLGLLILVFTVLAVRWINKVHRSSKELVRKKKEEQHAKRGGAVDALIDIEKQIKFAHTLLATLRCVLLAGILFGAFWALLWVFPRTHSAAMTLLGYLLIPAKGVLLAILDYLPNLFEILVILVFFRLTLRGLRSLAEKVADKRVRISSFHSDWAMPTYQLLKVILLMFMLVCIFPLLPKSESSVFKGVSVFLGVLLSLGSSSIISNIVSGFIITYMRPFKIGDGVKIDDRAGAVIEKNYLVTRILTSQNEVVTIPNSKVMSASTINYSLSAHKYGLILPVTVTVGYTTDWRKVHEILVEAALKTPRIEAEPRPTVLQKALNSSHVSYQLNATTREAGGYGAIYSELHKNIFEGFAKNGIELVSPEITAQRVAEQKIVPASADGVPDAGA